VIIQEKCQKYLNYYENKGQTGINPAIATFIHE